MAGIVLGMDKHIKAKVVASFKEAPAKPEPAKVGRLQAFMDNEFLLAWTGFVIVSILQALTV